MKSGDGISGPLVRALEMNMTYRLRHPLYWINRRQYSQELKKSQCRCRGEGEGMLNTDGDGLTACHCLGGACDSFV